MRPETGGYKGVFKIDFAATSLVAGDTGCRNFSYDAVSVPTGAKLRRLDEDVTLIARMHRPPGHGGNTNSFEAAGRRPNPLAVVTPFP